MVTELHDIAILLQLEHKHRFRKYTDCGDGDHDSIFLLSTFIIDYCSTHYKLKLPRQSFSSHSKMHPSPLTLLRNSGATPDADESQEAKEPALAKRFCHLSIVLEEWLKEGRKKAGQEELDHYLSFVQSYTEEDPLNFWLDKGSTDPVLSKIAADILAIPASSAPIE